MHQFGHYNAMVLASLAELGVALNYKGVGTIYCILRPMPTTNFFTKYKLALVKFQRVRVSYG